VATRGPVRPDAIPVQLADLQVPSTPLNEVVNCYQRRSLQGQRAAEYGEVPGVSGEAVVAQQVGESKPPV
jgi:hypothetical protein